MTPILLALTFTGCDLRPLGWHLDILRVDFILAFHSKDPVRLGVNDTKSVGRTLFAFGDTTVAPQFTITSSDPRIAVVSNTRLAVIERRSALMQKMAVAYDVTGVTPGRVIITAQAPGNSQLGVSTDSVVVDVVAPNLRVMIAPAALSLTPESTAPLTCSVTNADNGTPIPNARFEWSSSQPAVAAVDQNGTVTTRADGIADITCRVAGLSASATARITVTTPPPQPPAPAPDSIRGTYQFVAFNKLNDNCIAGTFPGSIEANARAEIFEVNGVVTIELSSDASVLGVYDRSTGNWSGSGQTTRQYNGANTMLVQRISGQWASEPSLTLFATTTYVLFTLQPVTRICEASYNSFFTKIQ